MLDAIAEAESTGTIVSAGAELGDWIHVADTSTGDWVVSMVWMETLLDAIAEADSTGTTVSVGTELATTGVDTKIDPTTGADCAGAVSTETDCAGII